MESNIEVGDGSHLGETNGVKDVVSELPVEDKVAAELKGDEDKDEVSELPVEEKVTVELKGNEDSAKGIELEVSSTGLEDRDTAANEDSNGGNVEISVNSLQDKEESESIDDDDDEKFEEAIEAAVEDEKFEEAVDATPNAQSIDDETGKKLEVMENDDSSVQDQNESNEFARDETEQLELFDTVESGKAEILELADLDATTETCTSISADQVNENSDEVAEEPKTGVLDHSPGETLTSNPANNTYDDDTDAITVDDGNLDEGVHEELGTQDANEVKGGHVNSQKHAESYKDILLRSEKPTEVRETSGTTDNGFLDKIGIHDHKSDIPATGLKSEKCTDIDENYPSLLESVDPDDGKIKEGKDAPPSDTSVNGHHGENLLFNEGMTEKQSLVHESLDLGKNDGEQKDVHANDDGVPDHQEGSFQLPAESNEKELPDPATLEVVSSNTCKDSMGSPLPTSLNQDSKYEEQEDVQRNDGVMDHQGGSSSLVSESNEKELPDAATLEVVSSNTCKDSMESPLPASLSQYSKYEEQKDVQSNDGVLDHQGGSSSLLLQSKEKEVPDPATERNNDSSVGFNDVEIRASSSNLVVESSKHFQPLEIPKSEPKEPDNKQVIYMEENQTIPKNIEVETKPATDSSPSVASATHTTPPARPAGLGRAAPLLEPAPRVVQQPRVNGAVSPVQNQLIEESTNAEGEESDETREKLQMIRVKFLRLAHRLGQTPHNVVVAQVLYRLGLAEQLRGRNGGRVGAFSFDRASAMAEQLEAAGQEPLDFSCTIMVLGKTGVGKSSTINSIFDEGKFGTDAFQIGTKKVQDVVGTVQGIKVRVIDTPGLLPSWSDQRQNEKILHSVKNFIKKTPPDIVLYLDRLDMQSRDYGDMPLLRTITDIFGPSIWFNAIVVLTHAASAPPEGPNGTATSYDMFVTQRSHVVQQAIRQAAGDMRLMNPVSLVENHSACRTNRAGQRVLPNGQVWKPHLLLLSFASKILAEANTLLKLQDSPPGRTFSPRARSPPLPFLLSSLLQSRPQVKLPMEQFGDDDETLDDLDESSDSEEESEYDQLPPFKSLKKAQLAKLTKEQRKAYYDELEYREKLFMRKQLKEERRRRKAFKKLQAAAKDLPARSNESVEEDINAAASVPVPMPDLALPASFDSDNPTHRYRCLDSSNQWLVRPVLDSQGWDHDVGYEGINVERLFVVKEKLPISFSGQVSKDKKDSNLQMEIASSVNYGDGKATSLGFDMQSLGKDIAYTLRSETKFINFRKNKATAGLSATLLGDAITGGVKVEDKLIVNKRGQVVISGGAMFGRGDVAYGGSLEATLRDKDHPLGRFLSTLGISIMDWHGDLAIGCNSQTQIPVGRHTNLIGRININNRGSGQVSLRLNSSEQLQIALICLVPLARKILGFSQQGQYT